jgi:hypothetical protein
MPATQLPTLSELLKAGDGWEALMPANSTPQMGADHPLLPRPNTPWIDGWRPWFNRFGGMC